MEETKKLIRSLLISSPLKMTVANLNKDYQELEGEPIPYRKLGFSNLESFLFHIPDVVEVLGQGRTAQVRVVADAKVAHIDRLVSLQKAPQVKRSGYGNRPRGGKTATSEPLRSPSTHKNFVHQYIQDYPINHYVQPTQQLSPLSPVYRDYYGQPQYSCMFQNDGAPRPSMNNSHYCNHSTDAVPKIKYGSNPNFTSKNKDATVNRRQNGKPGPYNTCTK